LASALRSRVSLPCFGSCKKIPPIYSNGQKQDYTGGRTTDTIVTWVNKKAGPASAEVACDDLAARTTGKLNMVYFGNFEGELFNEFMAAAKTNDNYLFFHVSGVCAALHGQQHPGVSIFRSFDESPIHFSGASSALGEWMDNSAVPTLIEFSEDFIEPIFGKGKEALILFSNDREASYNKIFADAASQLKGQILFVVSGTEQGIQQRLAEFVGVDTSAAPTIRLLAPGEEMRKFVFSGSVQTLTVSAIKAFVDDFKAGKLAVHLKSEPEPET